MLMFTFIRSSFVVLCLLSLFSISACNAPEIEAQKQNERIDAKSKTVDAKQEYEKEMARAAKLREEAAKLQLSNNPQDVAKGVQLTQDALKIEADAIQKLPQSMRK